MKQTIIYVPKSLVKDRLEHYGFAAVIEVTAYWQKDLGYKVWQAKTARDHISELCDDKHFVAAGAALVFNDNGFGSPMTKLDFRLNVNHITRSRLNQIIEHYISSHDTNPGRRRFFETILDTSVSLPDLLKGNDLRIVDLDEAKQAIEYRQRCAESLGMSYKRFSNNFNLIAGDLFEVHTALMFMNNLDDRSVFTRKRYKLNGRNGRESDIDVLVLCPKRDFKEAMNRMRDYDGVNTCLYENGQSYRMPKPEQPGAQLVQ